MARPSIWLDKFDRGREFEVRRPITVSGHRFAPGQRFNKTLVTTRRLRLLYEARKIVMLPEDTEPIPPDALLPIVDPLAAFEGMRWLSVCKEIKQLTGVWPNNKAHAVEVMTLHLAASGGKEPQNGTAPLQSR